MKNYMPGFIISLILFIVLTIVNQQVYSNVMPLSVVIPLLAIQVIFYKYLILEKKRIPYFILVFIFLLSVFLSLPELTYNQAKEKVMNEYEMNIVKTNTVVLESNWNPFSAKRAYFFKGVTSQSEKEISVMVVPDTGKVFVISK